MIIGTSTKVLVPIIDCARLKMSTLMGVALIWVGFVVIVLLGSRVTYYIVGRSGQRQLREKVEIYQKLMGRWSKGSKNDGNS